MAELVHLRLERCFQELEEMKRIKLFTLKEVKKIAAKRCSFEYKLRRRKKKKEDYLQYIEFEICLLRLIDKRRKRLLVETKKKEIDNSIAKKINRLFKAVISRFPDDEKLWLNQVEYFKRMKWHDSINALYTKILQVHSNKPDLWIKAAEWEMEHNNSFENARIIFQRALLMHPKVARIWHEYFRMELQYIEMIKKRKAVLKLHDIMDDSGSNDAVLNGNIVNVVYEKAVEEIPGVSFSLSFVKICMEFDATINSLHILSDVEARFPNSEETFDALAKVPLLYASQRTDEAKNEGRTAKDEYIAIYDEIFEKYEAAVLTLRTEKMWSYYLDFLLDSARCCAKQKEREKMETVIVNKLKEAASMNCLSEDHYSNWLGLLEKNKSYQLLLKEALFAAEKFNSTEMWLKCLRSYVRYQPEEVNCLFTLALHKLIGKHPIAPICNMAVDYMSLCDPSALKRFFELALKLDSTELIPLREVYLESTALREGSQAARELYQKLKYDGKLTPGVIKKMIIIEQSQLRTPIQVIRKYYEESVKLFGGNQIDVWLDYMNFEMLYGNDPKIVDMIQWKGKKSLKPDLVDQFQISIGLLLSEKKDCYKILSRVCN